MTAQPYFAEAAVNRLWGHFFGRGIVDPVDDFRSTNPASNSDLLNVLADDFRQSGYDLKHLMRTVAGFAPINLPHSLSRTIKTIG